MENYSKCCSEISIFWIFFIQFYSAGHILSTAEVPNFTPTLYFRVVFAHSVYTNMDFVPAEFILLFENCIIEPFIISVFKPVAFKVFFVGEFSLFCKF